eukprot:SAG31_NODE_3735_length_3938_cov_1.264913_6_plen_32_part_01
MAKQTRGLEEVDQTHDWSLQVTSAFEGVRQLN